MRQQQNGLKKDLEIDEYNRLDGMVLDLLKKRQEKDAKVPRDE